MWLPVQSQDGEGGRRGQPLFWPRCWPRSLPSLRRPSQAPSTFLHQVPLGAQALGSELPPPLPLRLLHSPDQLHLLNLLQPHLLLGRPGYGDLDPVQDQGKLHHLGDPSVLSVPSSFHHQECEWLLCADCCSENEQKVKGLAPHEPHGVGR